MGCSPWGHKESDTTKVTKHSTAHTDFWTSQVALVVKNSPPSSGDIRDEGSIARSVRVPSPGDLPDLGIELESPTLLAGSLPAELPGKPKVVKSVGKFSINTFFPKKKKKIEMLLIR